MSKAFVCLLVVLALGQVLAATTHTITNAGNTWDPATISITKGDSIKFTYSTTHNVAESSSAASNEYNGSGFRSGEVGANNEYTHKFDSVGTFYYICEPHAAIGMKGVITVVEAGDNGSGSSAIATSFALIAGAVALVLF